MAGADPPSLWIGAVRELFVDTQSYLLIAPQFAGCPRNHDTIENAISLKNSVESIELFLYDASFLLARESSRAYAIQ